MEEIKEILGSSCNTYFKMTNGQIFVASSEFRAKSGEIDGFIVYKEGIKDYNTGIALMKCSPFVRQCGIIEIYQ